jgi:hypothetical protein
MTPARISLLSSRMMLAVGLVFLLSSRALGAAIDLGQNLIYVRLQGHHDDAQSLKTAWSSSALIVDLRYPAADAAHIIPADLPIRAPAAPLFVLVASGSPAAALAALRTHAPALITIGLTTPELTPDLPVAIKPADDRRAFEALDSGTSVQSLLNETLVKPRFDEATFVRGRARDQADASPPAADAAPTSPGPAEQPPGHPGTTAEASSAKPAAPPDPIDAVLLRAVRLDRALLALGKLPRN